VLLYNRDITCSLLFSLEGVKIITGSEVTYLQYTRAADAVFGAVFKTTRY